MANVMEEKSLSKLNSKLVIHSGWLVFISITALTFTVIFGGVSSLAIQTGLGIGLLWSIFLPILWKKDWFAANAIVTTWCAVVIGNWVTDDDLVWPTFQYLSLVFLVASLTWYLTKKKLIEYLEQDGINKF